MSHAELLKPLSNREKLDHILSDSRRPSISVLQYFYDWFHDLYDSDAGVWEGQTIMQHTRNVLGQFDTYFAHHEQLPLGISMGLFRVVLALHDIGKPYAIEQENKSRQHEHTAPMVENVLEHLQFSPFEIAVGTTLVSHDSIGNIIKQKQGEEAEQLIPLEAEWLRSAAAKLGVQSTELMDLQLVFFQCDAGAYTLDAGSLKSLDYQFVFDREHRQMGLSKEPQRRIALLRNALIVEKQPE